MKWKKISNLIILLLVISHILCYLSPINHFKDNSSIISSNVNTEDFFSTYFNNIDKISDSEKNNEIITKHKNIMAFSTEGGFITALCHKNILKYMNVNIFGEMFRSSNEYFFYDNFIIISLLTEHYTQPFYIDPGYVEIKDVEKLSYIYKYGELYNLNIEYEFDNSLPDDIKVKVVNDMKEYIQILMSEE